MNIIKNGMNLYLLLHEYVRVRHGLFRTAGTEYKSTSASLA